MDHRACANSKVRKHYMKPAWTTDEGIIGVWRGEYLTRWQFMDTFERESLKFWCYYGKMFNDHYFKQSVASKIRQRERVLRGRYRIETRHRRNKHQFRGNPSCEFCFLWDKIWRITRQFTTIWFLDLYGYRIPQQKFVEKIWL